jgi:hypothetical protein
MYQRWRAPEELVEIGFNRSRVVMMNEAHNGDLRCVRTRAIGRQVLPTAHRLGVRHLAMEALYPVLTETANSTRQLPTMDGGYLGQPEMRAFVQAALDLGWTLIRYEEDLRDVPAELAHRDRSDKERINWREEAQARNLLAALEELPAAARLLVWCGNGHLSKASVRADFAVRPDGSQVPVDPDESAWTPMGYLFKHLSGLDQFVIDQTPTVNFVPEPTHSFPRRRPGIARQLTPPLPKDLVRQLKILGGTAGFLAGELPAPFAERFANRGMDAYLLSTENDLT